MRPKTFSVRDDEDDIRAFFDDNGFVLFSGLDFSEPRNAIARGLDGLLRHYPGGAPWGPPDADTLGKALMVARDRDRAAMARVYDTAHALPALFALLDDVRVRDMLRAIGHWPAVVGDTPRLRVDFPDEDKFLTVEHQEFTYYDCPASSTTVWFPLTEMTPEMGLLSVRPGSHKAGVLPVRHLTERPYFVMEPGEWETRYPRVEVEVHWGEALIFSNGLIHGSGQNRSDRPRVTAQVRHNSLRDPEYAAQGWPRTFTTVARKDQTSARSATSKG